MRHTIIVSALGTRLPGPKAQNQQTGRDAGAAPGSLAGQEPCKRADMPRKSITNPEILEIGNNLCCLFPTNTVNAVVLQHTLYGG